ncbi:MAG: hypothetical protein CME33_07940 [Gimesia sp.]|mgnify:FL=1|uniref:serine/threonine-protein kinase n=1 Tax=Gimesia sp. TaxID=2024833 RepID=UPI000C46B8C0|nr:serine/threonine-protein kinase [Gimesia sp.]MAX36481.1 hypothetical protein [Gimesia sp.]|tara:strand:- start:522 stop:4040 length:3519 start_codon:yes stop_codon:yes gene_type:complete
MSKENTSRVQELFAAALELPADKERDTWLAEQCGHDQALLEEVLSLLEYDSLDQNPLEGGLKDFLTDIPLNEMAAESRTEDLGENEATQVIDCDTFLSKLSELSGVGVLSKDEIKALREAAKSEADSSDPRLIASNLVSEGKLTQYQASALLQGSPELLIQKYLILDLIDVGGMGMVFKAIHRTMNRVVAVKMISQNLLSSPEQIKRFQREVRVAATLDHPNVVRSFDADQANGVHFLVMEYVRGANLSQVIKEKGPLSLEQAVSCILQAARGLRYAHKRGIIHRDIKPGNLMMDEGGTIKVLDLGLANVDESVRDYSAALAGNNDLQNENRTELTNPGMMLGTISYMAPEQSLDASRADSRSDIYSLGCTFYFLLIGEAPYRGDSIFKVFLQHQNQEISSIREQRQDVPQMIEDICFKMLAKNPDDRYQTMGELITAIEECEIAAPVENKSKEDHSYKQSNKADQHTRNQSRSLNAAGSSSSLKKFKQSWLLVFPVLFITLAFGSYQALKSPPQENGIKESLPTTQGQQVSAAVEKIIPGNQPVKCMDENLMSAADLLATGEWEWKVTKKFDTPINNSSASESCADMTADKLTLVYSINQNKDNPNTDIWMTTRESVDAAWTQPIPLGKAINTEAVEFQPSISADGLELMFTRNVDGKWHTYISKRTSSLSTWSEAVSCEEDGKYQMSADVSSDGHTLVLMRFGNSENGKIIWPDLYIRERRSPNDAWGKVSPIEFPVNTDQYETEGTISDDGRILVFVRIDGNTINSRQRISKLYIATRSDRKAEWSTPVPFENQPDSWESRNPRLQPDGKTMLICSDRPGSGYMDIWMAELVKKEINSSDKQLQQAMRDKRIDTASEKGSPRNHPNKSKSESLMSAADLLATGEWEWKVIKKFDAPINMLRTDSCADMTADGKTIVFSSSRNLKNDNQDLWMSTRDSVDTAWSQPVNLGEAINTEAIEFHPSISADGRELLFSRKVNGSWNTYISKRSSTTLTWSKAVPYQSSGHFQIAADLSADGHSLIMTRMGRAKSTQISTDLWISTRLSKEAPWSNFNSIGFPVNTNESETEGTISDDGRMLIFARAISDQNQNIIKKFKLFISTRSGDDSPWSDPVLFESKLAPWEDRNPRLLADGKTLLLGSDRPGSEGMDIWKAELVKKKIDSSNKINQPEK